MFCTNIQPVIFAAGTGSRMTQLTGGTGGNGISLPKCLIRVCGNPLIFYPLKSLANYGFSDVIITLTDKEDVRREVDKVCARVGIKADYVIVSEDDEDFGTFQSLRQVVRSSKLSKNKEDIMIVSCDTILDTSFNKLVLFHKAQSSACTAWFLKAQVPTLPTGTKLPGPKVKAKAERDVVGIEPDTGKLVFLASEADFEDELRISAEALKKAAHTKIYTSLIDSHIYLMRRHLLEQYVGNEEVMKFLSIKGEFLPFLINSQWGSTVIDLTRPEGESEAAASNFYAVIHPEASCIRVNTVKSLASAAKSLDWLKQIFPNDVGGRSKDTTICKTAKLVASSIGDQCSVGEKAKLVNVITMDNVTIEEGATVENSIISASVTIGSKAVVKDSIVGPGYRVPEGGKFVNESLSVMEENLFAD